MSYERIRIGDIAFGGDGVGRLSDGAVVFVPQTAVGDDVTIEITERKPTFCRGVVAQLNEPGPGRTDPVCKHYGTCGGCAYQHLDYPTELQAKARQFKDLMTRIGKLENLPEPVVVPAVSPYGYRNKLRLEPFDRTLTGNGYRVSYGYCQKDNTTYFTVRNCALAHEELNKLIVKALHSDWGKQNARRPQPYTMTLRIDSTGKTEAYFGKPSDNRSWLRETLLGFEYRVPVGSFWQVNPPVAEKLLSTVQNWLSTIETDTLIDAYGGVGTFSIALGANAKQRYLIECDPAAITAADNNYQEARMPGRILRANTEDALESILTQCGDLSRTTVVLDPPRTGCLPAVIDALIAHPVGTLVYVSCNVATLSRDTKALVSKGGYTLEKTGVFDMFPRTAHFESAILLKH